MSAPRRLFVATLITAASLAGAGAATAAPLPLETPAAPSNEPVAGGWCDLDPLIGLWCLIASPSA
ncbi:hypothetical protein [Nocardia jejuensis]|uniref:hypothetical protein n=1 Tax=Nocardia jejuensis TaxID=328049 RepID=UPI0008298A59|nr:hypothetical protein [Nocardia jejuensis]